MPKNFPIHAVNRLRMGTDGCGITSLLTFYGCPLKCKYCLNPQCHDLIPEDFFVSLDDIFKTILLDELYYIATNGGVTFGGGEPLLYPDAIIAIMNLGAKRWHTTVETSFYVPFSNIEKVLPYVNDFIIDIKDMNPDIYYKYTGENNSLLINNLQLFSKLGFASLALIRIPMIRGFNTIHDIENSKRKLEDLGYSNFDIFEYRIDVTNHQ